MRDIRLKTKGHTTSSSLRAILFNAYNEVQLLALRGESIDPKKAEQFIDTIVDVCISRGRF